MIISLKDFALTGNFGPVRIGMSKNEVIQLLGRPSGEATLNAGHVDVQYGNYEFFFDRGNVLYAIQNDRCDPKFPKMVEFRNRRFKIDPWVLRAPLTHTLTRVGGQLEREGIPHSIVDYFGRTVIQFPSKVVLDFSDEGDDPPIIGIRFWPVPLDEELLAEAIPELEKVIAALEKAQGMDWPFANPDTSGLRRLQRRSFWSRFSEALRSMWTKRGQDSKKESDN
jgi:hypothetical protein